MITFIIKIFLTAIVVSGVSELAKRIPLVAAILVSLPLTSILSFAWLYWDTGDVQKVSGLSIQVFWMVLPSLAFFLALPILLKKGVPFYWSLSISCGAMALFYFGYVKILQRIKISI